MWPGIRHHGRQPLSLCTARITPSSQRVVQPAHVGSPVRLYAASPRVGPATAPTNYNHRLTDRIHAYLRHSFCQGCGLDPPGFPAQGYRTVNFHLCCYCLHNVLVKSEIKLHNVLSRPQTTIMRSGSSSVRLFPKMVLLA